MTRPIFAALALLLAMMSGVSPAWGDSPGLHIGSAVFAKADIADARAQPNVDGTSAILLSFEGAAAERLDAVGAGANGRPTVVLFDGQPLATLVIPPSGSNGALLIDGGWTLPQAEALALRISGKPPLPDSLDE